MNADWSFYLTIAIGACGVSILFSRFYLGKRRRPSLAEGVAAFLMGAGVIAGVNTCLLTLDTARLGLEGFERVYVFLGGIAVTWVSIEAFVPLLDIQQARKPVPGQKPRGEMPPADSLPDSSAEEWHRT